MGAERYVAYGVLLGLLGYNLYFHFAGTGAWPWRVDTTQVQKNVGFGLLRPSPASHPHRLASGVDVAPGRHRRGRVQDVEA